MLERISLRYTTKPGFGLALWLLLLTPLWVHSDGGVFASASLDGYSEPEPLQSTLDEWGKDFDSGERQWLLSEVELGYRFDNGISLSAFRRGLASTRINKSAVRYYGRIERNEPLPEASVPVTLTIAGFTGQGVRLGYFHREERWSTSVELSIFQAKHLMDGGLSGTLTSTSGGGYELAAEVDYRYYRDVLFHRPDIDRATGIGRALDVEVEYQLTDRWRLSMQAEDLWAAIEWGRAPYTLASANSQRASYDESGFVSFSPLFEGTEGYREDYKQTIDPRYQLSSRFQSGHWSFNAYVKHQFGTFMPVLGISRGWQAGSGWEVTYDLERQALGGSLIQNRWALSLVADNANLGKAKALYLALSYSTP